MNKITIVGSIIAIALGFGVVHFANANSEFTVPAFEANADKTVTVGPDQNIQVVASTTRSYLYIARDNGVAEVYCSADGDKPAVSGEGFKLATSTSNILELHLEQNPYDGAVRCTASASTTLSVVEYKRR